MYGHVSLSDPLGVPYPGDEAMHQAGDDACRPLFKDYVGIDYESSEYIFWFYTPDAETWDFLRRVDCAIGNAERSMMPAGTAKDSKR